MADYIIGGGFASFLLQGLLPDAIVITPVGSPPQLGSFGCRRRVNLEFNKVIGMKSYSYGAISYEGSEKLHDRLMLGGNSAVWGGFIDLSKINGDSRSNMERNGLRFCRLTRNSTGSFSPNKNYHQIQDSSGGVFDVSGSLSVKHNGYLLRVNDSGVLEIAGTAEGFKYQTGNQWNLKVETCDRVYLAIGVVQILDLLVRSGKLKDGDKIDLDEFGMTYSVVSLQKSLLPTESNDSDIYYYPSGAISHGFGFKKRLKCLDFLNGLGIVVRQRFHKSLQQANFILHNNVLQGSINPSCFGASIHYCNLRVNGDPISDFIARIWPNFSVVGMAAVVQNAPGPISNDIFKSALEATHNA